MLVAHGGGLCPLEIWGAVMAVSAAGGAAVWWSAVCAKVSGIFTSWR